MPAHRKQPTFIRIIANEKSVVCINPLQCSSFQILEGAMVKTKTPDGDKVLECNTVRFFFPSGTGLSYSVGIDIDQAQFDYICATLFEYMYYNEAEFKAKHEAINKDRMDEWNKLSTDNEAKLDAAPKEA